MAEGDTAGVIAPPPLIFLSGIAAGGVADYFYPAPLFTRPLSIIIGLPLIAAGLGIILSSLFRFKRANTKPEPWKPTTAIVADGIYKYTRNPMYLGMAFVYLGLSFAINSLWFLPFLPVVLFAIHYGVILREEAYLERKFGQEYLNYKTQVRRWI